MPNCCFVQRYMVIKLGINYQNINLCTGSKFTRSVASYCRRNPESTHIVSAYYNNTHIIEPSNPGDFPWHIQPTNVKPLHPFTDRNCIYPAVLITAVCLRGNCEGFPDALDLSNSSHLPLSRAKFYWNAFPISSFLFTKCSCSSFKDFRQG